jgi:two-component system, NarL family, nitrate/nitrite response regulator NarL
MVPSVLSPDVIHKSLMFLLYPIVAQVVMDEPLQEIRILIADERAMFREALRDLLARQPGLKVVGEAASGAEALQLAAKLRPNILLLDLCTPSSSGMETLRGLAKGALPVRAIIFADGADKGKIVEALKLGARGILEKQTSSQLLLKSIRAVAAGEYWVGRGNIPDLIECMRNSTAPAGSRRRVNGYRLTPREIEIIKAIADGSTNKEIAEKFRISEQTVKHHLTSIFGKVGVSNRLELALFAMHNPLQ